LLSRWATEPGGNTHAAAQPGIAHARPGSDDAAAAEERQERRAHAGALLLADYEAEALIRMRARGPYPRSLPVSVLDAATAGGDATAPVAVLAW